MTERSVFSVDHLPRSERASSWQTAVRSAFLPLDASINDVSQFFGEIDQLRWGHFGLSRVAAGAQTVQRSRKAICGSECGSTVFIAQTSGESRVNQDGESIALKPGDLTFVESDRPYELVFEEPFEQCVLQAPTELIAARHSGMSGGGPFRMDGCSELTKLFVTHLERGFDVLPTLSPSRRTALFDVTMELLAVALSDALEQTCSPSSQTRTGHMRRAKHYVLQNIKRTDLSVEEIAKFCGISTRYLRGLFSDEGHTASSWMRKQRLECVRMDLERASTNGLQISQIAYRWGFADYAHFSRCFKTAYGRSPSKWRKTQATS